MPNLEITTTSYCKNRCSYCPQPLLKDAYPKQYDMMTLETFKTCLSKVPKDVEIVFAGYVEPFLNPLASEMMNYSYCNGYKTLLNTTLVDLKDDDIDILKHVKFHEIICHLPDEEGEMKANITDEYLRLARRFVNEIGYNKCHVYGNLHHKLKPIFRDCREKKNIGLHSRADNLESGTNNLVTIEQTPYKTGKIYCGVIKRHNENKFNHNVLLPNGFVSLCCNDYGLKHVIGNLLLDEYEDLFKSKMYKKVMRGLEDEGIWTLCRTCSEVVDG